MTEPPTPGAHAASAKVAATVLASQLAARLCHDFVGPASAIASGFDLLEDPAAADLRDDTLKLIEASAGKLIDLLAFSRVAFGASAAAESFDTRELERLVRGVYRHVRPEVVWRVELPALAKAPARVLLNLAQLAAELAPAGGTVTLDARVQAGEALISAECEAARVRLKPELASGLRGEPLQSGLGGAWVQAYFVHALATAAGGRIDLVETEGRAALTARLPG